MNNRVPIEFFKKDALEIAPQLLEMKIVRRFDDNKILSLDICDVEIYRGDENSASHSNLGRSWRYNIMYHEGGKFYVYAIFGTCWLLNITAGKKGIPQLVLIRGTKQVEGPCRVGKVLNIDKTFYGEEIATSQRLWFEYGEKLTSNIIELPCMAIDYAGEYWGSVSRRLKIENEDEYDFED